MIGRVFGRMKTLVMAAAILAAAALAQEAQAQVNEHNCGRLADNARRTVERLVSPNSFSEARWDRCEGITATAQKAFLAGSVFGGSKTIFPSGTIEYHLSSQHGSDVATYCADGRVYLNGAICP